ncbi:5'-3' exonuclease [Aeromicrobium duanguangcaii]|uniref:5'-3' exonuclease n=1 Tax=Aeromicrobium duanguangcaii TaxID=2968086 RepID=A0ABY5KDM1_9ACTN|nr:5'-3' exonuclease [Aeromicrobium duanguangcaii]MCD9152813.1 5'-3' exonuclease [Aeromicrobium duanguangcaii]MCL3837185.1 5'-3' exonuclease [Aeromicrobium duanguangcaii]UUI67207.1 5'-3' exonuclease [Aeromicrobium duanguangcaii]
MSSRLLLLDTASLYFRAFYGVPDSIKAADGRPVNAIRGIVDFLATLQSRYEPEVVVAAWDDDWRPAWRVELLDTYKTHRLADPEAGIEETPDLLAHQVPLIAEVLTLAGATVVGAPEAEADDVIGTLVRRWDTGVDVVTGDRDLFQLVDDARDVRILYTARGVSKHDVVDAAWVRDKYGIEPSQYVDFAVMRGDASDGLPGVAGIGDKTAATLLGEFGDLAGIRAAAADPSSSLRPRIRQSLLDSADYIDAAVQVVTVRPDLDLADPVAGAIDVDGLRAFGEQWNVAGPIERLLESVRT